MKSMPGWIATANRITCPTKYLVELYDILMIASYQLELAALIPTPAILHSHPPLPSKFAECPPSLRSCSPAAPPLLAFLLVPARKS